MPYHLIYLLIFLSFNLASGKDSLNVDLYAHAKACPVELSKDIVPLVNYLKKPANNPSQVVEVFFYWITEHIEYDVDRAEKIKNGLYLSEASSPLETGLAICQDYADLLQAMCRVAGIECYVVVGYAKARFSDNQTRADYSTSDHAWNIVKVDQEYKIVDATWGSGYVEKDKFYKEIDLENLFAAPDIARLQMAILYYQRAIPWYINWRRKQRRKNKKSTVIKQLYMLDT